MENVDSGWEKKEWSCVDDFWGKGCGWKGSGCDCLPFCLLVDLENFVNIGRNGDLPKGCPNCGHRLFSVESPLVRSKRRQLPVALCPMRTISMQWSLTMK